MNITKKHEDLKKVLVSLGKYSTAWEIRTEYKKMFGEEFSKTTKVRKNPIEDTISARLSEEKAQGFFDKIARPRDFLAEKGIAYAGNNKRYLFGLPEWEKNDEYLPSLKISKNDEKGLIEQIKSHSDIPIVGLHAWKNKKDGSKFDGSKKPEDAYGFIYELVFSDGMKYIGRKVFSDGWEKYYGSGTSIIPHIKKLHSEGESVEIQRFVLDITYHKGDHILKEKIEQAAVGITDDRDENRRLRYLNNMLGGHEGGASRTSKGSSTVKKPLEILTYIIDADEKFPFNANIEVLSMDDEFVTVRIPRSIFF